MINGAIPSRWQQLGAPEPRAALDGDVDCDVCIVGGGLTGLWTAFYLKRARPGLRFVVLETEFAGFGASGRNGGWLSAELLRLRASTTPRRTAATAVVAR